MIPAFLRRKIPIPHAAKWTRYLSLATRLGLFEDVGCLSIPVKKERRERQKTHQRGTQMEHWPCHSGYLGKIVLVMASVCPGRWDSGDK